MVLYQSARRPSLIQRSIPMATLPGRKFTIITICVRGCAADDDGNITVYGGVRRLKPAEIPWSASGRVARARQKLGAVHCVRSSLEVICACISLT